MPIVTRALSEIKSKYDLGEILGQGTYGTVRKCRHKKTKELLAVKTIAKSKVKDVDVLKREISILKQVSHPNIIDLVDVFEDEENIHIVTELCTGGELYDRVLEKWQADEGHFEEADAARIIRDVLDAIAYCHSKDIVHRDLKPENFLLKTPDEDAPIKIIDFGLSRYADATIGIMQSRVGTPYYVAPEVLQRNYTSKCDIWSIGVICYILLCGYAPFAGDNDADTLYAVENYSLEFPSPEWDEISSSAKDFVSKLLQKDPYYRPTAKQALEQEWIQRFAPPPPPTANPGRGPLRASIVPPPIPGRQSQTHKQTRERSATIQLDSVRQSAFQKFLHNIRIQKALGTLTAGLTKEETKKLGRIFARVDRNQDGQIALTDIDRAVAQDHLLSTSVKSKLTELRNQLPMQSKELLDVQDFLVFDNEENGDRK